MQSRSDGTPAPPGELLQRSSSRAIAGVGYAALLFFGSWLAIGTLWSSGVPLAVKALGALPFLVLAGYGTLLMGFMGHDGIHFTLAENRELSSLLGILVTAPLFPYMLMGFGISHWNHHEYTNGAGDPDSLLFSRFDTLLARAFLARPFSFWQYGSHTLRLAFGVPLPFEQPFPLAAGVVRRLARINLALSFSFAALYFVLALTSPIFFAALAAIWLVGTVISGLSPYVEHTGTGLGRGQDTRTAVGWWWDALILGNNYHLEHHLYPTLPFYRLKAAHRYLVAQGYFADGGRHVSRGAWDTYRYVSGKYPYPSYARSAPEANG